MAATEPQTANDGRAKTKKSKFRARAVTGAGSVALSQRLVTDGLATDGEKLFCSDIFGRISVLWRKMDLAARSNSDLLPISGKLVEIH